MQLMESIREQLVAWLDANGVDAKNVPHDALMTYADGQLTTDLYVTGPTGGHVMEPNSSNTVARTSATYPVTTPPPDVAWWLRARCPTCGR
jgi:hypothetical protein